MHTGPPLRFPDEHVDHVLIASADVVARAPGALYPAVHVGPVAVEVIRRVVSAASAAAGYPFAEWPIAQERLVGPLILLCDAEQAAEARAAANTVRQLQLVVRWEGGPQERSGALHAGAVHPGDLQVDLRGFPGPQSAGAWLADPIRQLVAQPRSSGNPLVVLTSEAGLRSTTDQVELHLEACGTVPVVLDAGCGERPIPRDGAAIVAMSAGDAPERWVDAAVGCRNVGVPFVLVAPPHVWEHVRLGSAWSRIGACSVVHAESSLVERVPGMPWPAIRDVWLAEQRPVVSASAGSLMLPDGTSLVEGLAHVEAGGRPTRLVAWTPDHVAVIGADRGAEGMRIVGVETDRDAPAFARARVLGALDRIRGWKPLSLALVEGEVPVSPQGEPIPRAAFHLSRLDDERGGGPPPAETGDALPVHLVACTLVQLGLPGPARVLLRCVEGRPAWTAEADMLLAYLVAATNPDEAVLRLREAAVRSAGTEAEAGSERLQTDATLNALLLLVRARRTPATVAWASVDAWLREAGTAWLPSARYAAVLFELAARAGETQAARHLGERFRDIAGPEHPLALLLAPALRAVGAELR